MPDEEVVGHSGGYFIQPTVLVNVGQETDVWQNAESERSV